MPEWFQTDASRTLIFFAFIAWCWVWWAIQDTFDRPKVPKWVTETSKVVMLGLAYVALYSVYKMSVDGENYAMWFAISLIGLGPVWALPTVVYQKTLGKKIVLEKDSDSG